MKFKVVAAVGLSALVLAGCGERPSTEADRFSDIQVNGTRCIVYTPSDSSYGVQMQCDFAGYVPTESIPTTPPPVDAGPSIDSTELSPPPPESVPEAPPVPTEEAPNG